MIKIVHKLRQAKGRNNKIRVLEAEQNNELWKKVLVAMYDSSINYYVAAPYDNTFTERGCEGMFSLLDALSSREITGNKAKAFALSGSEAYGEIFRLVLIGSLKAGVSVKTINAVYPGLIPTFDVMLAKDIPLTEYPVWASTKFDGVRVIAFVNNSTVELRTRSGKLLPILSLMKEFSTWPDGVYDGELVKGDGLQSGRTGITGSVNKVLKGTRSDIPSYTLQVFDCVSLNNWRDKICTKGYLTRLRGLNDNIISEGYIRVAAQERLLNSTQVEDLFSEKLAQGYEGLILRYPEDMYIWDRTPALIKKKAIKECTLRCTDIVEGLGKYEGLIGSLVCEGEVDELSIRVKVGSGLSDYDRSLSSDHYIGSSVEVLYNDIVKAKKAEFSSLFLPRFKRVKGNKDI